MLPCLIFQSSGTNCYEKKGHQKQPENALTKMKALDYTAHKMTRSPFLQQQEPTQSILRGSELDHGTGPSAKQPLLTPILALHRHDDGYISFAAARDAGDDFRPLIAIRRDELARYFPEFRDQFLKDAYVSINAGWHLRRHGLAGSAHGYPLHRTDRLRYCARLTQTWIATG
jgi:hypothetical protein